ncbi:MAG: amino acid adenylation domain-containing protein [Candidatus Binatia bacterium]
MDDREDSTIYKVVVNHDEQYSIWFTDREPPAGWKEVGTQGRKVECMAYIKKVLTDMPPEKRALLEWRLKQKSAAGLAGDSAIPRRQDRDAAPMSFAQQRLWFLDQLEPGSSFYNMAQSVRLEGSLNVEALTKSLCTIVDRHEVLRTNFIDVEGVPSQRIAPAKPIVVSIVDLTGDPDGERSGRLQRVLKEEIGRPFDLSRDLMLRATLVKLAPSEHILLLMTHHIASDGWSSAILWHELATLYRAFSRGEPDPLPELPIQYSDYAVWQRHWLQGDILERQLSYWKTQLSGLDILKLPTDRARPAVQTYRGSRQSIELSKELTEKLKALSRKEKATLFMTLLAAFQTLLYRYSGQEDVAMGSPIAGRTRFETERLIGFFINTLVLRSDLSGDPTFRELLGRVRKSALDAYEHQDIPFEKLVEELHLERDLSRSPLVQVIFALQNVPRQVRELPGLTARPVDIANESARFDLTLYTWEESEELRARLQYNTDLFDHDSMSRMLNHFTVLLQGIVANPDRRISDLPILIEAERHQLLVDWNDTQRGYPRDKCLHELFEEQVERSPDAVAVVFEDQRLTYRDLNARANRLARDLIKLGVGPETLVGIYVERSLDMIVGLLGILKAGGAYVPLDPAYPKERVAFMLQDAQVRILLTQLQLVSELPPEHGAQLLCIDTAQVAEQTDTNLEHTTTSGNLAYVIYTSGSTGKPKGVQISHGAMVNFLTAMQREPGIAADDTLLAVTTLCFDIAGLELYLPLTVGARVVLISREVAADGGRLAEKLADSRATFMQATPATWQMLVEAGWHGEGRLKILCGGETLTTELATQLLARSSSLWNMYGPTETTVWSSICRVETPHAQIPIGRPIANTEMYVLDRHQQPLPIGVPGELYIGGSGLARGYLNHPELTDEKFVPDPFRPHTHKRLYKTGDLARWLSDGTIEILGRLDNQVKIRGFRIELGEIEAVLGQHPSVGEAVVVAREVAPAEHRLVGYIVSKPPAVATAEQLSRFLKSKLPDYMVPYAFVMLDALPRTPNGKVDRGALPAPDQRSTDPQKLFLAPRTPIEHQLAGIWAEVLKLKEVGVGDNFFELGGHSLLATRVISRLRDAFRVELPLRVLFEQPTVAGLAERIDTLLWAGEKCRSSLEEKTEEREEIKL